MRYSLVIMPTKVIKVYTPPPKVTKSFRIDHDLHELLIRVARERKTYVSDIINAALRKDLQQSAK